MPRRYTPLIFHPLLQTFETWTASDGTKCGDLGFPGTARAGAVSAAPERDRNLWVCGGITEDEREEIGKKEN